MQTLGKFQLQFLVRKDHKIRINADCTGFLIILSSGNTESKF